MEDDEPLSYDRRPITNIEGIFQKFQKDTAISLVAEQNYKAMISKIGVTDEEISKTRSSYRSALRNLQATAQRLYTKATSEDDTFYQQQALLSMRESDDMLDQLNSAGLRRKRNKSRNKVYSAHKKSKRRRVKSTRRHHKKSTIHHRSKY